MPAPINTLLIDGPFSELAEELSQYIDGVAKAEDGSGLQAEVESTLQSIREEEQSESPDSTKIQQLKDDALKKIITKAPALNAAPEKGQ